MYTHYTGGSAGGYDRPYTTFLSYLIGVPKKNIDEGAYYCYMEDKNSRVFRTLCKLRTQILMNYGDFSKEIHKSGDPRTVERLAYDCNVLVNEGLSIGTYASLTEFLIFINKEIRERTDAAIFGFPYVLERDWLVDFLNMPDGDTAEGIRFAMTVYVKNTFAYPFQRYVNWNFSFVDRPMNILGNDKEFIRMMQERYVPAHESDKGKTFVQNAKKLCVLVDCENSDPVKLFELIKELPKVYKVVLIDDAHTTELWNYVPELLRERGIIAEREEVERVVEHKSLVDMKLATKACEEHYKNGVDSIMLATSDSDFWALISALPDVNFAIAIEQAKCGQNMTAMLAKSNITVWWADSYDNKDSELYVYSVEKVVMADIGKVKFDIKELVQKTVDDMHLQLGTLTETVAKRLYSRISADFNDDELSVSFTVSPDEKPEEPEKKEVYVKPAPIKRNVPAKKAKGKKKKK